MGIDISPAQRTAYYRAAFLGLHALDAAERTPRRFGPDAEARWSGFAGHLDLAERLDLLIRDAAVTWGVGFSPALIFDLPGLAEDEPFGPDWASLPPQEVQRLWASPPGAVSIGDLAEALDVSLSPVNLPQLTPSTRLFVAGGAAVCGVAAHFSGQDELSWPDQVLVVSERPQVLQLGGLVAPIIAARGPSCVTRPADDFTAALKGVGWSAGGQAVVSEDATALEGLFVRQAAGAV